MTMLTDKADQACILLVDDEPNVLKSLCRLLWNYRVVTAGSGYEALSLAEHKIFDLVLTDYRMPGLNGIDFLIRFKIMQPDTARLVLSGYADLQGVQAAINEAEIYRFINKPWHDMEVKNAVEQALEHRRMLLENRLLADEIRRQRQLLEEKDALLRKLEAEEPGITQVNWGADGSIVIDETDVDFNWERK
ncbi:MAG: response regulator [Gammaproteobacteria bacterium]